MSPCTSAILVHVCAAAQRAKGLSEDEYKPVGVVTVASEPLSGHVGGCV